MKQYFEWDEAKATKNKKKHKIEFKNVIDAFDDPFAITEQNCIEGGEYRWRTIGMTKGMVVVFIGHAIYEHEDAEVIRIMTARKADRKERSYYEHSKIRAR